MMHYYSIERLRLSLARIVRVFCIYCLPVVDIKICDHPVAFVVRESFDRPGIFPDINYYVGFDGLRTRHHT